VKRKAKTAYITGAICLLIVALLIVIAIVRHSSARTSPVASNICVSKQLSLGSTGACVSDAQTMVDFMESDGLTQCPFTGASVLNINGTYDSSTEKQVEVVQTWLNCYNKQEGEPTNVLANGILSTTTWQALCTYAYIYPSSSNQSSSSYLQQSIVAGQNAGCVK
jgi:hypothetical protein